MSALPVLPSPARSVRPARAAEMAGPARAHPEGAGEERPAYPVPPAQRVGPLWAALREVMDPEIPVSLVDLGLIYDVRREGDTARVDLTFTATACPCMVFIRYDIEERLLREEGVERVEIQEVWNPPWTKDRISPEGRLRLKELGIGM